MKQKLVYFSALFTLMIITGVFWGTWFTLTRSLESFSAEEFIHIGKVIISNIAIPMSVIMPTGIALMIFCLWLYPSKGSKGYYLGIISIVLMFMALLITLTILVPIDNELKSWTIETLPVDWENKRDQWKSFHAIRTFVSLASFALFTVSILFRHPRRIASIKQIDI